MLGHSWDNSTKAKPYNPKKITINIFLTITSAKGLKYNRITEPNTTGTPIMISNWNMDLAISSCRLEILTNKYNFKIKGMVIIDIRAISALALTER